MKCFFLKKTVVFLQLHLANQTQLECNSLVLLYLQELIDQWNMQYQYSDKTQKRQVQLTWKSNSPDSQNLKHSQNIKV